MQEYLSKHNTSSYNQHQLYGNFKSMVPYITYRGTMRFFVQRRNDTLFSVCPLSLMFGFNQSLSIILLTYIEHNCTKFHPLKFKFQKLEQAEWLYFVGGHVTAIHPVLTVKFDWRWRCRGMSHKHPILRPLFITCGEVGARRSTSHLCFLLLLLGKKAFQGQ